MTITYWKNFKKRLKSTKRPGTAGTDLSVNLKGGCSIEQPVFWLTGTDYEINYIKAFDRYYFVTDINIAANGYIEIHCDVDVGASYKSDIGSYNAFVERSTIYSDDFIPDPYVVIKNSEEIEHYTYGSSSYIFSSTGYYAVSVLNDKGSGAGFTTTYFMTAASVMQLAQYCNIDWGTASTTFLDWIQSNYLKTGDSVIDCVWLPIDSSAILTGNVSYEELKVGTDIVTGVYGYRATGTVVAHDTEVIQIPNHYTTDFRKGAPYQQGKLYLPMFGCVDFNPLDFDDNNIYISLDVDCCTGDVTIYIQDSSSYRLATYMYNVGVTCPVGKVNQNLSGTTGGLLSAVASGVTAVAKGGAAGVAAGIAATSSAINAAASALEPMVSYRGSKGGRSAAKNGLAIAVTIIAKVTTDPDDLTYIHGKPFMQYRTLSFFSGGYVKCSGADVPISGTEIEKSKVNEMLNTGFYYE